MQLLDFGAQRRALDAAAKHAQATRRLAQDSVESLQRYIPIWCGHARERTQMEEGESDRSFSSSRAL